MTNTPTMLSATEKAWAAGYVDGEGCISFSPGGRQQILLRISVSSVRPASLEYLKARWGGWVSGERRTKGTNQQPVFTWALQSAQAMRFLEDIKPYLVLKREHATLALAFQALMPGRAVKMGWCRKHGVKDPQCMHDMKARIRDRMRLLNARGRAAVAAAAIQLAA